MENSLKRMSTVGLYGGGAIALLALARLGALVLAHHDDFHFEKLCIIDGVTTEDFIIAPTLKTAEAIVVSIYTVVAGGLLWMNALRLRENIEIDENKKQTKVTTGQSKSNVYFFLTAMIFLAVAIDLLRHTDNLPSLAVGSVLGFSGLFAGAIGALSRQKPTPL